MLDTPARMPTAPLAVATPAWVGRLVDAGVFGAVVLLGVVFVGVGLDAAPPPPDLLVLFDVLAGAILCVTVWWRRRWPVQLALLAAAIGTFSDMAGAAGVVLLFTVAVEREVRDTAGVAVAYLVSGAVYFQVRPDPDVPPVVILPMFTLLMAAVIGWGLVVRSRRQLILSLRDRALRAESEQQSRVEQARATERTRIAGEMHDVLAHRISLVSLHAGALEFNATASPEQVTGAAALIRQAAHDALEDLREILGVLHADGTGSRPVPTVDDVAHLIEESRAAGMHITADLAFGRRPASASASTGRTAYRVVQEGLTNARKHSPGGLVRVTVSSDDAPGSDRPGISVTVHSLAAAAPPTTGQVAIPGSGSGLAGLAERVRLTGGRLEHGHLGDGSFRLEAWLPWHP